MFIANYIDGMGAEALALGLKLEVLTLRDGPIESVVEAAAAGGAAGCVILGTEMSREELAAFRGLRSPFVFVDTYDEVLGYDFVDMNNAESTNAAVELFAERGHRDIGLVTSDVQTPNFRMRAAAFREALGRNGLQWRKDWSFVVDSTFEGSYAGMAARPRFALAPPGRALLLQRHHGLRLHQGAQGEGATSPRGRLRDRLRQPARLLDVRPSPSRRSRSPKQQIGRLAVRALYDRMTARAPPAGGEDPRFRIDRGARLGQVGEVAGRSFHIGLRAL